MAKQKFHLILVFYISWLIKLSDTRKMKNVPVLKRFISSVYASATNENSEMVFKGSGYTFSVHFGKVKFFKSCKSENQIKFQIRRANLERHTKDLD